MRTNKILACAAIAASLVACNKKNEAVKQDGNTYTSVQLRLAGDNLRAEPTQNDNLGTTEESTVNNISLVANGMYDWSTNEFTKTNGTTNDKEQVLKTKIAKAATAGENLDMALIVNAIPEFSINNPDDIYKGAISKVIKDGKFVMTSKKTVNTIKPSITKEAAEAAAENGSKAPEKNFFDLGDVERVVAKGIVMNAKNPVTEIKNDQGEMIGKVSDLMYAAVNGATKTYALLDHAGKRKMEGDKKYTSFESAIHGVNQNSVHDNKKASEAKTVGLVRLSNYIESTGHTTPTNENIIDYKAIKISENKEVATPGVATGKYFFENSADLTKEGNKSFYRLAYAKIYATFIPKMVWKKAEGATKIFVEEDGYGVFYEEDSTKKGQPKDGAVATDANGKLTDGTKYVEGYFKYSEIIEEDFKATENDGTFYVGEKDQQLYADKLAAAKGATKFAEGQRAHTYKNGKMAWRALWNRRMEGAKIINGDARRNNIYVLTINSFTGIGMNYDPSDPDDPNLPDPNDPNDPTNPDNPNNDDPHVENQDTYIAVTATVQPWNVVSRGIDLGGGNDNI